MTGPVYCHPRAYEHLRAHLPSLESTEGLLQCVIGVGLHEFPETEVAGIDHSLWALAEAVRKRVRTESDEAKVAHLHAVLFDEMGFTGNTEDYYSPLNSYLPAVLASRKGLPILLSLIYKVVGERVGLEVVGINAPLHFMAAVMVDGKRMLVDPFFGGRAMSKMEAFARIEAAAGQGLPHVDELLPVATHRQWLVRIIHNLIAHFERHGQEGELKAMMEMRGMVGKG